MTNKIGRKRKPILINTIKYGKIDLNQMSVDEWIEEMSEKKNTYLQKKRDKIINTILMD